VKKTAYNIVEQRYLSNSNDKIAVLRNSVPSLRELTNSARGEDADRDTEDL
jgi:hypothetical protein